MTVIIKTIENELIISDTEEDTLFAMDKSYPYFRYYYNSTGAIYATKTDYSGNEKIVKQSITDLKNSLSGAEISNEEIAEKAIELLS